MILATCGVVFLLMALFLVSEVFGGEGNVQQSVRGVEPVLPIQSGPIESLSKPEPMPTAPGGSVQSIQSPENVRQIEPFKSRVPERAGQEPKSSR